MLAVVLVGWLVLFSRAEGNGKAPRCWMELRISLTFSQLLNYWWDPCVSYLVQAINCWQGWWNAAGKKTQWENLVSLIFSNKCVICALCNFSHHSDKMSLGKVQKKGRFYLGKLSQIWVSGVASSHPGQKKPYYLWPELHLLSSQISQKPWGGWVGAKIWEFFPK